MVEYLNTNRKLEGFMQMRNVLKLLWIVIAVIALSACGPRETPEPTVDINVLSTNAAMTVAVEITQTAMSMPTETPLPTYTPISNTPTAPVLSIPTIQTGGTGSIPSVGETVPTVPAALPTATLGTTGNACVYAGQNIADGTVFKAGQTADLIWSVTNSGTTTWTTDYSVRFFSGTNFAKAGNTRYTLPVAAAPQATAQFPIDITAPSTPGEYKMAWVISDEGDNNFCMVDITIKVE